MRQHQDRHDVAKMAFLFGVSRSSYYEWKAGKLSCRAQEDLDLSDLIRRIFFDHKGRYGSPRVWEELKALGWCVSRKRVERLMREQLLYARKPRRILKTGFSHGFEAANNLLDRDFRVSRPGEKWVSDITYIRSNNGWLYLTVILDLWDRKVIGWSISEEFRPSFVCRALEMAVGNRSPREGLIFHSDQGVQYCSYEFRSLLVRLCPSVRQSMSRKGNCWDNACAESFFKTLKTELGSEGRCSSKKMKSLIAEYIENYYNRLRRHSAIGYAIPAALSNNDAA